MRRHRCFRWLSRHARRCCCGPFWRRRYLGAQLEGLEGEEQAELAELMLGDGGAGTAPRAVATREDRPVTAPPLRMSPGEASAGASADASTAAADTVAGGVAAAAITPAPAPAPAPLSVARPAPRPPAEEADYLFLPGYPETCTSMEAAVLMSILPHEHWTFQYIRDEDRGEGDAECRVCLCDYELNDEIVRLPCMHYAHTRCVEEWFVRSPKCPVCRTDVREALQMEDGS